MAGAPIYFWRPQVTSSAGIAVIICSGLPRAIVCGNLVPAAVQPCIYTPVRGLQKTAI
jgi:hypothetical protein